MRVAFRLSRLNLAVALSAALATSACHLFESNPVEVNGGAATSFSIALGQEIDIFLQTIGPGEYGAPPTVNGSAITFLEVTPGGLNDPGGPTQLFHFRGVEPGTAIITFTNDCGCPPYPTYSRTDTVIVR